MVNSKFHLIRSYYEICFYHFPNISCLKCTVNSNFHLIQSKTLPMNDFKLTVSQPVEALFDLTIWIQRPTDKLDLLRKPLIVIIVLFALKTCRDGRHKAMLLCIVYGITVKTIRMAPYVIACSMTVLTVSTYPGSCKTCFSHIPVFGGKVS